MSELPQEEQSANFDDLEEQLAQIGFEQLFDLEELQRIQDLFSSATGVASIITQVDGTPITSPSNFCSLCNDVIRKTEKGCANCFKSDALIGRYHPEGPIIQPCLSGGLWDAGASITVGGRHAANWLIGQVRNESQDEAAMLAYADEIGADREVFRKAFREVPVMSKDRFDSIANALFTWANQLSETAFQNIRLERIMAERERVERRLKEVERRQREELEGLVRQRTAELEASNEHLSEMKEAAEAANRAKSVFLANMSHELRTPLNAVLGYAEILKERESDPEKKHFLHSIETGGDALLGLIDDILDLSKIETGKLEMRFSPVSIGQLFENLEVIFRQRVEKKGLVLFMEVDDSVPDSLLLDETRFRQVMINLIGNSVKFTEAGHIRVTCSAVNNSTSQVSLQIEVEDTGIGIPEEEQERIFNPFEQVMHQKKNEYGGTGLGLAITQRIIHMLGGVISVSSVVGEGALMHVDLPEVEVAEFSGVESVVEQGLTSTTFLSAKVLIADDIDYNRDMMGVFLRDRGLELLYANDGIEAVEMTKSHHPDLILMDMKMPGLTGLEATEAICEAMGEAAPPIIAVTASALKQDEEVISRLCDGYLRKPLSRSLLLKEMSRFLPVEEPPPTEPMEREGESVIPLPKADLEMLFELALDGNLREVRECCQRFASEQPRSKMFCEEVGQLAQEYRDSTLITHLRGYLSGEGGGIDNE